MVQYQVEPVKVPRWVAQMDMGQRARYLACRFKWLFYGAEWRDLVTVGFRYFIDGVEVDLFGNPVTKDN